MFWCLTPNWMEGRTKNLPMLEKIGKTMYLEIGNMVNLEDIVLPIFYFICSRQIWGVRLEYRQKYRPKIGEK